VPPLATSKSPARSCVAPVKAPRACPNSSLSSSVSVTAPQLMATNTPWARAEQSWMSRAMRSFPTPLSPVTVQTASPLPRHCCSRKTIRFP